MAERGRRNLERYGDGIGPSRSPEKPKKKYIPPVGPGSKSLPPLGSWRDSPVVRSIISDVSRIKPKDSNAL